MEPVCARSVGGLNRGAGWARSSDADGAMVPSGVQEIFCDVKSSWLLGRVYDGVVSNKMLRCRSMSRELLWC